jgi:hypothetical protein
MLDFMTRSFRALGDYVGRRVANEYHDKKLVG